MSFFHTGNNAPIKNHLAEWSLKTIIHVFAFATTKLGNINVLYAIALNRILGKVQGVSDKLYVLLLLPLYIVYI